MVATPGIPRKCHHGGFSRSGTCCAAPDCMAKRAKKILLVEDNDEVRELLALFMKHLGYNVFEAATGLEAIDQASTVEPDLILMDLRLPGINGDDVTAQLKATASTKDIPVLITTGYLAAKQVRRAFDSGAAEVLYKPIDVTMLRDVLRRYLSARTKKRRSPRKN
jgi:two-component system cell cycle response regulator DivK